MVLHRAPLKRAGISIFDSKGQVGLRAHFRPVEKVNLSSCLKPSLNMDQIWAAKRSTCRFGKRVEGSFLPKVAKGSNLLPLKQLARAMHLSKNGSTKSGAYWVPEPNLTILSEVCPASSELITSCNRPNRMTRLVPRCRAGSNTQVHEHPAKRGQATTPRMHSSHYPYSRCPELAGIRKPRGKLPQTIPTQQIMQKRLFRNGKAVHE